MAYHRLRPQTSLAHFGTLLCFFLLSKFPNSIEAGHSDAPTKFGSPELRIYHNASVPVAADPLADPQSLPHRSKEGYASAISDDVLGQIFSSIEAYQGSGAHKRMGKAGHRRGIQSSFGETTSSDGLRSLNPPDTDYTRFVNTFIGTSTNTYGDVFPGASVPFGMAKIGINNEGYAPAGYLSDIDMRVRGVSPLHDSGTGSSLGEFRRAIFGSRDTDLCPRHPAEKGRMGTLRSCRCNAWEGFKPVRQGWPIGGGSGRMAPIVRLSRLRSYVGRYL